MKYTSMFSSVVALSFSSAFAEEPAVFTSVVQLESPSRFLDITVDGKPVLIGAEEAYWEITDKDPDIDDFSAQLKEGSRFCLETKASAACHIVAKGKTARFIVHRKSKKKSYNIEIKM